jgi:3alpha(or 20beta)-hydroxysteroid dehydrogenase
LAEYGGDVVGRPEGKVAIVAGGARGLGEKFAEDFVGQGGRVAIGDVNAGLGSELASRLGNDKAVFVDTDVTDPAQCANVVDVARKEFGSLDYLVNSAIAINGGELIDLPLDKWRATIDIGLTGTFLMGQAFVRRMVSAKRKGAVVNLSSVSAFQRTVATIRPTYHKRQKSGPLASIIRRNGELLTRSLPPGNGLPRYVCTMGHPRDRTSRFHQITGYEHLP